MRFKKIIFAIVSGIIAVSLFQASAATPETATPWWTNTRSVTLVHGYLDGYACCDVVINAYSGTTRIDNIDISLNHLVDESVMIQVEAWEDLSCTGNVFEFYDEADGVYQGRTYRLQVSFDVHRNGITESLELYKDVTY